MNNWKDPVLTSAYLFVITWFGLGFVEACRLAMFVAAALLALYVIADVIIVKVPVIAVELNHLWHRYLINREVIRLRRIRIELLRKRLEDRMLEPPSTNLEGAGDDSHQSGDCMADTPRVSDDGSICDRSCDLHGALSVIEAHPLDSVVDEAATEGEGASPC